MSTRFLTADWIYPVHTAPVKEGVLVMNDDRVQEIITRADVDPSRLEFFDGMLIPGFINTHCHLELSHMKGKVDTGTGLITFISNVVKYRDASDEQIKQAIADADQEMWSAGIQAVGDICNKIDTFETKSKSRIAYYSFVEMFDFLQAADSEFITKGYQETYDHASGLYSAVPHAPYSVSPKLFAKINRLNHQPVTVSIHNQETKAEDDLFRHGNGEFYSFYNNFGIDLSHFRPSGTSSIHYALQHMDPLQRTLFVHNTLTTGDDIAAAHRWSAHTYWSTCPNANLYIENRLPDYKVFLDTGAKMSIGTDSLTSNWQLSILEEMKTISRYQSIVPFETLLTWATLNGAQALGLDDKLGSFEKNKTPGVLCLHFNPVNQKLFHRDVCVERLI